MAFTSFYVAVGIFFVSLALSYVVSNMLDKQEDAFSEGLAESDVLERKDQVAGKLCPYCHLNRAQCRVAVAVGTFVALLLLGASVFALVEHVDFVDALYFSITTMSTVGYGDRPPTTDGVKIFSLFWLCFGTLSTGRMISVVIEYRLTRKMNAIRRRVLEKKISSTLFSQIDANNDDVIDRYEFLVYHLVAGKWPIDQDDIDGIMQRFRALDASHSGYINKKDLSIHDKA